jgi:AcrR family transcriptional regulator
LNQCSETLVTSTPRRSTAGAGTKKRANGRAAQDDAGGAGPGTGEGAASAHRPSRRHLIVDAAIRVFARKGFTEASIQEIADEAGMVATAVYYHFAGKEELFEAAVATVIEANTAVVAAARPDDAPGDPDAFRNVMNASWKWASANPDMARLLFLHLPGGATAGARRLMNDYRERAVNRAYDYFTSDGEPSKRRRAAADYAARTLAVRTVIGLSMAVHPLQMEGGPLSSISDARIRSAAADICARVFTAL